MSYLTSCLLQEWSVDRDSFQSFTLPFFYHMYQGKHSLTLKHFTVDKEISAVAKAQ
jgi:hypothetical protein